MAEFPSIGSYCDVGSCKQLDFLPFQCDNCAQFFCLDHRFPDNHNCPKLSELIKIQSKATTQFHPCSLGSCNTKEPLRINCHLCDVTFCVKHRHPEDHECEKLPKPLEESKKSSAAKIFGRKESSTLVKKGSHSEALALKVALIKLKAKAVGDRAVASEQRVYFEIDLPDNGGLKAFYFNRTNSIGKAIDDLSRLARISNSNNVTGSPRVDRKVAPLKLKINGKTCKTLVFRCKPCKVEFLNGQLLEEHFVTCGAQSDKKFRCKVCKMGFLNKSGLSSHLNIKHRGRKPFACSHCKKTFVMNHHMMAHFRYAHAASKPHLCKICNKDFIFIWDLKKHMKGHAKGAFKNGGKKVARGPKLERKFDPFLEEDEDESTVGEEEEEIFPDVPLETSRQKGRESAEDRESIARDVEDNLRLQLMEQKRTFEAELERALEEQRCLSNKRIEIYKNVVENLQEKNANATKLISGVKSVLKDVSKKLLTKDQALNEYEDRICKYKNRLRRIEESEVEFRLAWEAMENSKDQQESANLAETDGDSAPSSDGSKCVNSVWDRSEMKEKMRSSWMKLSDRIRNKSSDSSENDL